MSSDPHGISDLSEEIAILRLYMRRLALASRDETDPEKLRRSLLTFSFASIAVTNLFFTQVYARLNVVKDPLILTIDPRTPDASPITTTSDPTPGLLPAGDL